MTRCSAAAGSLRNIWTGLQIFLISSAGGGETGSEPGCFVHREVTAKCGNESLYKICYRHLGIERPTYTTLDRTLALPSPTALSVFDNHIDIPVLKHVPMMQAIQEMVEVTDVSLVQHGGASMCAARRRRPAPPRPAPRCPPPGLAAFRKCGGHTHPRPDQFAHTT